MNYASPMPLATMPKKLDWFSVLIVSAMVTVCINVTVGYIRKAYSNDIPSVKFSMRGDSIVVSVRADMAREEYRKHIGAWLAEVLKEDGDYIR